MNDKRQTRRIPWGFGFLGPADSRRRYELIERVAGIMEEAGFQRIKPSMIDYLQTFTQAARYEFRPQIVSFQGAYDEELAVRPDLTIQVIKGVANQMSAVEFPARLYYCESVVRNQPLGKAEMREIFQVGVELIGAENEEDSKVELVELAARIMDNLIPDHKYVIAIGHVGFFERFCELCNLSPPDTLDLGLLVDNKDAPGIRTFLETRGLSHLADGFENLLFAFGDRRALDPLLDYFDKHFQDETLKKHIDRYLSILETLGKKGLTDKITSDIAMVRDFHYYTGLVFEVYAEGSGQKLLSGGAYNHLFAKFAEESKNAAGFALNLEYIEHLI